MTKLYDFSQQKIVSCFGFIRIQVPGRWLWQQAESGNWGFWEENDEESGTLWVDYNLYPPKEGATEEEMEGKVSDMVTSLLHIKLTKDGTQISVDHEKIDGRHLIHRISDTEEDGEMLRFFRTDFVKIIDGNLLFIYFSLVIPHFRLKDEDMVGLIEMIGKAIRGVQILELPGEQEETSSPEENDDGIPLKEVALGDHINIRIPEKWLCSNDDEGKWSCSDHDEKHVLYVQSQSLSIPESEDKADLTPTARAEHYVTQTTDFLENFEGVVEFNKEPIQSGRCIYAVVDHEEDGEWFRTFRWYVFRGLSDGAVYAQFLLSTRRSMADDVATKELINMFGRQARRINVTPDRVDEDRLAPLKDQSFDRVFTIRLPCTWRCSLEDNGIWWCRDPDESPGRMWAGSVILESMANVSPDEADAATMAHAEKILSRYPENAAPLLHSEIEKATIGVVVHVVEDDADIKEEENEDNPPLRIFNWHYVIEAEDKIIEAFFRLMIPIYLVKESRCVRLVKLMDQEIRAARIGEAFHE